MRKICPFMEPWPLAMIDPNRLLNSLTITPESRPAGAFTAVTEARDFRSEQLQPERLGMPPAWLAPVAARYPPACPCRAS